MVGELSFDFGKIGEVVFELAIRTGWLNHTGKFLFDNHQIYHILGAGHDHVKPFN